MGALVDLVKVLFEPTAVFERLREKPRILAPLLGILALYVVIILLMQPFARVIMEAAMRRAMEQRGVSAADMPPVGGAMIAVGIVVQAIFFLIIVTIGAVVLWIFTALFGSDAKFSTLFSVSIYTTIVFIIHQAVAVLVLTMRGPESIAGPADLQPALGLDLLAPGATGFTRALLGGINPFSLFGMWLTGLGVSITHRLSRGTGLAIAAGQLIVILLVVAALASLQPGG
jgi:hypothetical protein